MTDLFDSIYRRKSCRKYDMRPLPPGLLDEIERAAGLCEPLYPAPPLSYRFTDKVAGAFAVAAPHYLIISGRGEAGELENAGFRFQRLALWLDAHELGCVWLGGAAAPEKDARGKDIIALAFGRAAGAAHREIAQFRRKGIDAVTNAPEDECARAARLAPSSMNNQPWYFQKEGAHVYVYRRILKGVFASLNRLTELDMGIALRHYALARERGGKPFAFRRDGELPAKRGYAPFGVIE